MSSSSLYEPEEDNEASDSDIETGNTEFTEPPSSPPSRRTRLSSPPQLDGRSSSRTAQTRRRVSRMQMLEHLQASLSKESVEAYSNLLTQTTGDYASVESKPGSGNYQSTQAGIVSWAPKEKEILFNILDRKGRDGIRDIASAIGTKSELEVQEYLRLLHRRLEWQHMKEQHSRTIVLGDVPAAEEVSSECCDVLDEYSKLLVLKEQQDEDVAGRETHHDLWIIDRDKAELVEELGSQDQKFSPGSSVYHTTSLLNIPRWIRLSERLFMNFGGARLEDNWVNIAYAGESPAITADALADFYTLTVSVTRRLIQSTLFFAMSRLRNMRETGNSKAKVVKPRDVRTALDVMQMKRDGFDYWTGVARRCCLDVSDSRHRKGWKSVRLSHDDVEDMLSNRIPIDAESNRSTSRQRSESRMQGNTDGEHTGSDEDNASDSESEFKPERSPVPSAPLSAEVSSDEDELPSDSENQHAEQEDQRASYLGELELWKALDRPAPAFLIPIKEDQDNKIRKPTGERKTQQELRNWRERTLYRSDWEEYGHEVYDIYEEISEKRRKRRRLDDSRDSSPVWVNGENNQTDGLRIKPTVGEYDSPSEDEDIEMGESTAPGQNATTAQDEEDPTEERDSGPEINNTQRKQTTLSPSTNQKQANELDSPVPANTTPGHRSPILTRRRRIQAELKQDEASSSSGSDDDLPAPREYSSSVQDDRDGMPLYSQPMSPAD
ncbi:hypothetical protein BDV37DRAFT_137235 [Aspergillus pseudonomiae]|uniref:Myb-like domain-containing protein n=1 Tax=Aspergillus pseudonomiae TaxID=1506151 RepID=A0A5N7DR82_9EURO|nr:uncharacterized protein BDV37DRAFT_137235 [Aspergillus pseudonomiae]KAE8408924.1 hypothetical protein BDV37DRAFT_137235 [Aspergillus pseudonomiae]